VVGEWTDELGFVHARRHQLVKPTSSPGSG
jgi:hypothetical protein